MNKTKVFYNSKIARLFTFISGFSTIMLFGYIFTECNYISRRLLTHMEVHSYQYKDCFILGIYTSILLFFTLAGFSVFGWGLVLIPLIPFLLYYIIYGVEFLIYLVKYRNFIKAVASIGFERQASWIEETWDKPYDEKHPYDSYSWWKKLK